MVTNQEIKEFWEKNPFQGYLSKYKLGTREYYLSLTKIRNDFTEKYSKHLWHFGSQKGKKVLDIGCGAPGWLVINYAINGAGIYGIDLTKFAVRSTKQALKIFGLKGNIQIADAAKLPFTDNYFDFISSHGVLHHTLFTEKCIEEIYRVLKHGGKSTICLYYKGLIFQNWFFPVTKLMIKLFFHLDTRAGLKRARTPEELCRMIDGDENPLSKMYTKNEVKELFKKFSIKNIECHLFPIHLLRIPKLLHRILDKMFPLMIYVELEKPVTDKRFLF